MRFIYKGKLKSFSDLPTNNIEDTKLVPFEDGSINVTSFLSCAVGILFSCIFFLRNGLIWSVTGTVLCLLSTIPHELLHGIFYQENEIYRHKVFFLSFSTNPLPKKLYIAMLLAPAIIFGAIPTLLWMVDKDLTVFGVFGFLSLSMCINDIYQVIVIANQVPSGVFCLMDKDRLYWKENVNVEYKQQGISDVLSYGFIFLCIFIIYLVGFINKECVYALLLAELAMATIFVFLMEEKSGRKTEEKN